MKDMTMNDFLRKKSTVGMGSNAEIEGIKRYPTQNLRQEPLIPQSSTNIEYPSYQNKY